MRELEIEHVYGAGTLTLEEYNPHDHEYLSLCIRYPEMDDCDFAFDFENAQKLHNSLAQWLQEHSQEELNG